jgi:hypothetical protein
MECVRDLGTARSRVPVQRNGEPAVTGGIILIRANRRDDILFLIEIGRAIEPRELVLELDSELAKLRAREVLVCVHGWILLDWIVGFSMHEMQTAPPRDGARVGRGESDGTRRMRGTSLYSGVARILQASRRSTPRRVDRSRCANEALRNDSTRQWRAALTRV